MKFSERLKQLREAKNLTQKELGLAAGITERQIQNYEAGVARPRISAAEKLSNALGCTVEALLGYEGMLVADAAEKGGSKAARDVDALVSDVSSLFAGGELSDADKDALMAALSDAYFKSKEINKKYTPNKYRNIENKK